MPQGSQSESFAPLPGPQQASHSCPGCTCWPNLPRREPRRSSAKLVARQRWRLLREQVGSQLTGGNEMTQEEVVWLSTREAAAESARPNGFNVA